MGEQVEFREVVTRLLVDEGKHKAAIRYAFCGLGDQVVQGGDGSCSVGPRGCGHRLCPRCGRRRGGKYAKRILGWLAYEPHGDLLSMVLTQQVRKGEDLGTCRRRMAVKQRRYMRWLSRRGMVAGMTTVHLVWSKSAEGWHYHVHIMAEFPRGVMDAKGLLDGWVEQAGSEYVVVDEEQSRCVVEAGGPILDLRDDGGEVDFWQESKGAVARAVQYPLRDMAQGLSSWRLGGDRSVVYAAAREVLRASTGWKMFRAWGKWRQACPAAVAGAAKVEEPSEEKDEGAASSPGPVQGLGTVHRLWREARKGSEFAMAVFRALEPSVRNASDFARRFVAYCRAASTGPPVVRGAGHG